MKNNGERETPIYSDTAAKVHGQSNAIHESLYETVFHCPLNDIIVFVVFFFVMRHNHCQNHVIVYVSGDHLSQLFYPCPTNLYSVLLYKEKDMSYTLIGRAGLQVEIDSGTLMTLMHLKKNMCFMFHTGFLRALKNHTMNSAKIKAFKK